MKDLHEIAKQVCEELGICWDENATEPTINGVPVTIDDLHKAFGLIRNEDNT